MKRGFKGVWIPREIWLHDGLTLQEKILLVEIDSLDNDSGCFAQNKHFADFLGISERRVQSIIKTLKDKGYINISYTYKPGSMEIDRRVIRTASPPCPYFPGLGGEENDTTPHEENGVGVVKETTQGGEKNGAESNTPLSNTKESNSSLSNTKKKAAKADLPPAPDFSKTTFSPAMIAKVEEWLQYKKERREPYKPTGLRSLITELQHNVDRYGEQAVADLMTTCMAQNYRGIIFDKLKGLPERAISTPRPPDAMSDTRNEFLAYIARGGYRR